MFTGLLTDMFSKSNIPVEETTEITLSQNDTAYMPDEDDIALFEACNKARTDAGLLPLKLDSKICELAEIRCREQSVLKGHTRPHENKGFHTVFLENDLHYRKVGENIVIIGGAENYSKELALDLWLNSPKHKENLLDENWEYTGLCVWLYEDVFYAVQLFAC